MGCEIAFFLLNMLTAPLSPHFIQRTYIATSDQDLRVVMAAMLVAPFIAQIPGIVLGLTKSAYESRKASGVAANAREVSSCESMLNWKGLKSCNINRVHFSRCSKKLNTGVSSESPSCRTMP